MNPTKILAIAPYEGLREVLAAEAANHPDIRMDIYLGDLADGVSIATALSDKGYDVILSRGGTAQQIRRASPLPVVDIVPTVYDLLRYVRLAENMPSRFAIVGFSNITHIADKLFDLIQRKIKIVTLGEPADAEPTIDRLIREGITLIVGDAIATSTAKRLHINGILIASGVESVQTALAQAVQLHQVVWTAARRNLLFKDILDRSKLGVVVFDREQRLLYTNLAQNDIEYERVFRSLFKHVPNTLQHGDFQVIRRTKGGYLFEITGHRIARGEEEIVVFYVKYILSAPQQKAGVIEYYHMLDETQENAELPIDNIGKMASVLDTARRLSASTAPVCVRGGVGVPFDSVVHMLYHDSPFSLSPLVLVDCSLIGKKAFGWLLENPESPLYAARMTICMSHFTALDKALQQEYIHFVHCTSLNKRNRLIYTLVEPCELSVAAQEFFNEPNLDLLRLPDLRDRLEDVPSLASLYLSADNFEFGKQVIGLTQEAQALLQSYHWPGNNDQLHRVIRHCLLHTQAERILENDVRDALADEKGFDQTGRMKRFDLSGTLEEINARVIREVLNEEKMHHARTAERLGISRSTLWRMLK